MKTAYLSSTSIVPVVVISVSGLLSACNCSHQKGSDGKKTIDRLDGKFLADAVYFPQDTLRIKRLRLSDSTAREKLMIAFRNDSVFLSNYHFDGWYGKWFCKFYRASARFGDGKLHIDARELLPLYRCVNEDAWQQIDYRLIGASGDTLTFIKTRDTTNCSQNRSFYSRPGRGSTGDIDLR